MSEYKRWKLVIVEERGRCREYELSHEYQAADDAAREAENMANRLFEETDDSWYVVLIRPELSERQRQIIGDVATEQMFTDCEQDRGFLRGICIGVISRMSVEEQIEFIGGDTEHMIKILGFDPDNPRPWGCDQYGEAVPWDLVVVIWKTEMAQAEVEDILAADWYTAEGHVGIMVSADAIRQIVDGWDNKGLTRAFNDPQDCEINPGIQINRIADCLHRWSPEDGFYHA